MKEKYKSEKKFKKIRHLDNITSTVSTTFWCYVFVFPVNLFYSLLYLFFFTVIHPIQDPRDTQGRVNEVVVRVYKW